MACLSVYGPMTLLHGALFSRPVLVHRAPTGLVIERERESSVNRLEIEIFLF